MPLSPADGFTPLMLASFCGGALEPMPTEEDEAEDTSASIISDLICQGAQLGARTDRTGETALHLAARYARADAAKRLLDAGADTNAQDHSGRTPLHTAVTADAQGVFQVRWACPFGLQSWDRHQTDVDLNPTSAFQSSFFSFVKWGYMGVEFLESSYFLNLTDSRGCGGWGPQRAWRYSWSSCSCHDPPRCTLLP